MELEDKFKWKKYKKKGGIGGKKHSCRALLH